MFFGLQPIHIVFIVVVALLVFGPRKLPEMGRSIGKALNEFRRGTQEVTDSLRAEVTNSAEPGAVPNAGIPAMPTPPPVQSVPFQPVTVARTPAGNFCIHCGAANAPEARFCNQCGKPLPENTIKPADPSIRQQV